MEKGVDYLREPTTLVTFRLEDAHEGTLLTVTESGFDKVSLERRARELRRERRRVGRTGEPHREVPRSVERVMTQAAERARPSVRASAKLFAALGDETRLAVVRRLCRRGPASLTTLSEGAPVTRQAVAKHLGVLSDAGLIAGRRDGRGTVWELCPDRLNDVRRALDTIDRQWDAAVDRLEALVER